MSLPSKYTRELLEPLVATSRSFAEVIRKLNMKWTGGTQALIVRRIRELKIDTTHMLGARSNSGQSHRGGCERKSADVVLSKGGMRKRAQLVRAMREIGRPYACEECALTNLWIGKKIVLQVDHRDGDRTNNEAENVRFLCPNCHSQTSNWSGRKRNIGGVAQLVRALG